MNINEIITTPTRDEYLDSYLYKLAKAEPKVKINSLTLKKAHDSSEISYGLFDEKDRVVGQPTVAATDKDLMTSRLLKNTINPSLPRRRESRTS
jgi:hypothetical protein